MSGKRFIQDYTMVCRTCLQSNVEMNSLSALINTNNTTETSNISYMDALKVCIEVEETTDVEMPQRICLECSSALRVAFWFSENASKAQELLKLKLVELRQKKHKIETEIASEDIKKQKKYRCKICNIKVETKRSLKDHVKLHLDIIVYNCQICSFESHNRNSLSDHYMLIHSVEATKDQLKPRMKLPSSSSKVTSHDGIDGAIKNEHFRILPEDSQQVFYQTFTKPAITTNSSSEPLPNVISSDTNYATISENFSEVEGELNNELSLGNEFIVTADGNLEKVMNKDVVIEYINTPNNLSLDNGLVLDDIIHVRNIDNIGQIDVEDLIIEDPGDVMEESHGNIILPFEEDTIPASFIEQPKKIMCKICTKDFLTQEQLKNHMLTHNEIPHFFCDQCKFYTFFKIDLHQHYKSKHNLQPTNKQLQPKNKQKIDEFYACDLCFYEAEMRFDLKKHYKIKHNIEANEGNLKPVKVEKFKSKLSPLTAKAKPAVTATRIRTPEKKIQIESVEKSVPDYPNGLNCRKCHEVFYWRKKLYEHYKMHNAEEAAVKQEKQHIKIHNKPSFSNLYKNNKCKATKKMSSKNTKEQAEPKSAPTYTSLVTNALNATVPNISTLNSVAPLTPISSSTYVLPSDAIPQIVETDQTIENMDFDFNCDDVLFGDFDDDVDVEHDSDENDLEFRNILLTSDDDMEDTLQHQNDLNNCTAVVPTTGSYCAHCHKSFLSQYQFENHMFVHRGLAPYRCEMCTNLYNTKRCLIRHYKAVHKYVPTRDMIQAKGDKVCDDKTPFEDLQLNATTCLMCAKCPYETAELNNIKVHLKSSHNIFDESYIMKKLPFECPRCIRSFENEMKVLSHIQRNHSLTPINQHQTRFNSVMNTSEIPTNISITSTTTSINNHVNMMKTETSETNASCGYSHIFLKSQQQQQQRICPDAVTPYMVFFEGMTSSSAKPVHNETSSNINNIKEEGVTINAFVPIPFTPTALDEHDIEQSLFKCKLCSLICYNLAEFNEHSKRIECRKINVNSPGEKFLFECEICHCNYKTMYLLKHHLKRHIGRKFLCADCPKSFINKVELEAHKHVHSGERPHKCDVCLKSFRYVHHLKRHKDSIHFGKRHACTEPNCSRKFTTLAQLKMHTWTHYGIVPYKCPFCDRLFKKRLLLREHCLKVHYFNLSEEEMANIFRNSLGYTNPHDFTVTISNGKMLRRGDLETMGASGVIKSSFK